MEFNPKSQIDRDYWGGVLDVKLNGYIRREIYTPKRKEPKAYFKGALQVYESREVAVTRFMEAFDQWKPVYKKPQINHDTGLWTLKIIAAEEGLDFVHQVAGCVHLVADQVEMLGDFWEIRSERKAYPEAFSYDDWVLEDQKLMQQLQKAKGACVSKPYPQDLPLSPARVAGHLDWSGGISIRAMPRRLDGELDLGRWLAYDLRVGFQSQHPAFINGLQENFQGNVYPDSRQVKRTGGTSRKWLVENSNAADLLSIVQPYVRIRTEQVAIGLEFQDLQNRLEQERLAGGMKYTDPGWILGRNKQREHYRLQLIEAKRRLGEVNDMKE